MYYKEYGNSGKMVSAIGFGAMRFNETDVKENRFEKLAELPLYALDKGINYWDTAPFYCDDKSEIIIGHAVKQINREDIFLSSKTNFGTVGENPTRDDFRKRLDKSLTRMQTDYIDYYHMWCILNLDAYEKLYDTMYGWFEEAQAEGLIRNIVFSSHMEGDGIEKVIASQKFKGMLIGYNPLNYRFRQHGIESAHQSGMGVVAMNPVGGGVIPGSPETFAYLTEGTDLNVAQAALRFVASHKEVTVALNGIGTTEQVDEAVKAVEGLVERPAHEIVAEHSKDGIALNDLCTGCGYCMGCPVDIDIPKFMDAYNIKILTGKEEECLNRFKFHWGIPSEQAGECIVCGKCERECTQHLPIMERLGEIAEMKHPLR